MTGSDTTGPDEPDWDFPELTPSSVALPDPEPEPIYDTGSDGWWRAQAAAQREAAADEEAPAWAPAPVAPIAPFEWVEPQVLNDPSLLPSGPGPLDAAYLPAEELWPPVVEPVLEPVADLEPVAEVPLPEPVFAEPAPPNPSRPLMRPLVVPQPDEAWYDEAPAAAEPPAGGGGRIGVRRALAWAGLAMAGVGLVVVALLLMGKGEPKGTPAVTLPSPVASTLPSPSLAPTTAPTAAPTAAPTTAPTPAPVALAPVVPLTVLNNSRIHHLAETAAAKFRAGGWPVPATGNYRGQLSQSTIYYPPGQRASAERFGKQFGVRVLPRTATLPGRGMTVVVTRDFA